jgi:hypothetical protein
LYFSSISKCIIVSEYDSGIAAYNFPFVKTGKVLSLDGVPFAYSDLMPTKVARASDVANINDVVFAGHSSAVNGFSVQE